VCDQIAVIENPTYYGVVVVVVGVVLLILILKTCVLEV